MSRYWTLSYHPARAFWLERGLCLLLALDTLLLMVEHAGRYGVGGFNVAHFAWLDAIVLRVSPAPYLALLTASALLALCGAFRPLSRLAQAALALTYSAGWAISQHDSYQHHYLISWLLAWMPALPRPRLAQCRDASAQTSGAGLPLTALTCAIVYCFTAVSKSSPAWQSGAVLRQLARSPGPFSILTPLDSALGGAGTAFRLAAAFVLLVQIAIALGYAVAPLQDASQRELTPAHAWGVRVLCGAGWLFSFGFHLVTELQASFSIGWFSYYMLWISAVMLAPSAWLVFLSAGVDSLASRAASLQLGPRACLSLLVLLVLAASWLSQTVDLPGMGWSIACVGLGYLSVAFWYLQRGQVRAASGIALSTALSLGLTLACLTLGHVRFHYYRRLAGELVRMERLQDALDQYLHAERYAPRGQSRGEVIRRIERQLSEQRSQRHREL